jgi:hypothetical protein
MKAIWDITKLVTGKPTSNDVIHELKIDVNIISNTQGIADSLNSYIQTIVDNNFNGTSSVNHTPLHYLQQVFHCPFPNINHQAITSTEITKIIKSLKNIKNSYGNDEISVKIFKDSSPFIILPLTHMCNKVLFSGNFPQS